MSHHYQPGHAPLKIGEASSFWPFIPQKPLNL